MTERPCSKRGKVGTDHGSLMCPECGAARVEGRDCSQMLQELTSWEWDDPALAAIHFATVASFNLQHPAAFTDSALAGLRSAFVEHLDEGLPVAEIRRRHAAAYKGTTRVLKPGDERTGRLRIWPVTIAHAYTGGPAGAPGRAWEWVRAVRSAL
jgi:hypothetical protein